MSSGQESKKANDFSSLFSFMVVFTPKAVPRDDRGIELDDI
jgi:hypothetical protein